MNIEQVTVVLVGDGNDDGHPITKAVFDKVFTEKFGPECTIYCDPTRGYLLFQGARNGGVVLTTEEAVAYAQAILFTSAPQLLADAGSVLN
jgi:hypothetical protein